MGVSLLSSEQMSILKASPYVASITARQVSFTAEFKQQFYEKYVSGCTRAFTKQLLAYVTSESLEVDFVLETVQQLIRNHCGSFPYMV